MKSGMEVHNLLNCIRWNFRIVMKIALLKIVQIRLIHRVAVKRLLQLED